MNDLPMEFIEVQNAQTLPFMKEDMNPHKTVKDPSGRRVIGLRVDLIGDRPALVL